MLQQSTNPPQIVARQNRAPRAANSALDVISAGIQPIETDNGSDLLDDLCYMKEENDVRGMLALYDCFVAMAGTVQHHDNFPRTNGRASDYLDSEFNNAWSKAYLVADFLKDMRPDAMDYSWYAKVMFDCTLAMGNGLVDAIAVVNEIESWRGPR